jgi:hypothetical protein
MSKNSPKPCLRCGYCEGEAIFRFVPATLMTMPMKMRCGLCGDPLVEGDSPGPCRACWEIQVSLRRLADQIEESLNVMVVYRYSLEMMKDAPSFNVDVRPREAGGQGISDQLRMDFKLDDRLAILREYAKELEDLRSFRAKQRELRALMDQRLAMKTPSPQEAKS